MRDDAFLGRLVHVNDRQVARLPETRGSCVRFSLPPGNHRIYIDSQPEPLLVFSDVVTQRTLLISPSITVNGTPVASSALLPRFAVRLQSPLSTFPVELSSQLLDLVASSVKDVAELSDESSSLEQIDQDALASLLKRVKGHCDPAVQRLDKLQFILALQAIPAADPAGAVRFAARVYNTAVGEDQPPIELSERAGKGRSCTDSASKPRLVCVIQQALTAAIENFHGCLQVSTNPPGALVSIQPLSGNGRPSAAPMVLLPPSQTNRLRYRERALFIKLDAAEEEETRYQVRAELPHFITAQVTVKLNQGRTTPLTIKLQHVPSAPLYQQWWLWQLVGAAVTIGVTGAVAGAYANERGR